MMAVIGLSFSEMVSMPKVFAPRLIATFVAVLGESRGPRQRETFAHGVGPTAKQVRSIAGLCVSMISDGCRSLEE
jgi:hypothetical protein